MIADASVNNAFVNIGKPIIQIMNPKYIGCLIFEKIPVVANLSVSCPLIFMWDNRKRQKPITKSAKPVYLAQEGRFIWYGSIKAIKNHENQRENIITESMILNLLSSANLLPLLANT